MERQIGSSRTRAAWTVALVAIAAAVAFVAGVQELVRLIQVNRLAGICGVTSEPGCRRLDVAASVDALHRLDHRSLVLLSAAGVALLAAGIAWLVWQHRAQRLLSDRLATPGLRFSPRTAVGWWFVPLANLGMPAVTMAELYRASAGDDRSERPWRARPLPARFRWWWGFAVASAVIALMTRGQSDPARDTFFNVRANAAVLALGSLTVAIAGLLAIAVVRSIERRLELAEPYPRDDSAEHWSPPTPAAPAEVRADLPVERTAPQSRAEVEPRPPRRRAPAVLAGALVAVTAAAAFLLVAVAPSISPFEDPAAGAPSPVASFPLPAEWRTYGDPSLGFVMSAPPEWHEVDDDSPALLRLEHAEGADASCLVISDLPSAGLPLSDVVDELLSQIHDPGVYLLGGDVEVEALTVPAGPAERFRFRALREGAERGYVQYVLVNDAAGWLVGCDAPAADVDGLESLFERMISTFHFAR